MREYQLGKAEAFAELLVRHQDSVFRYFYRFLKNREAAEEATQEAFFNIIRAAEKYEPRAKFTTWMFRIVHNYGVDCYRRNKLRQMTSLDEQRSGEEESVPMRDRVADTTVDLENETIDNEIHARLQEALEALNPDQREVFLMRENLGLQFDEIAKILNISTNTAKSRMRYALSGLKRMLTPKLQPIKQGAQP